MLNNAIALIAVAALFGVEAIKVKERLPRIIFTVIAIFFGLWAVLVNQIADAWPKVGAFVTSTFEQPVSWFVLAIALFFVLRPFWTRNTADTDERTKSLGVGQAIQKNSADLLEEGKALRQSLDAHRATVDVSVEQLRNELAEQRARLNDLTAQVPAMITDSEAIKNLHGELEAIRRGCASLDETVKKNEKSIRESMSALWSRERMHELALEIERDANDLYLRLQEGENYTAQDWDQWTNVHHHWERVLMAWIDTARWYAPDVKKRIMTVQDNEYDGDWTVRDAQFPNADAVRRFKRHRIIQRHWQDVMSEVDRGTVLVAFSGMSEEEQHRGQYHKE